MIVKKVKLNFPTYEQIKDLPLDREHTFTIYNLTDTHSCRIIFNEFLVEDDLSYPTLKADMMDEDNIDIFYQPEEFITRYRANKKNYEKLCRTIEKVLVKQLNKIMQGTVSEISFEEIGE